MNGAALFSWVSPYSPDDARGGWKSMQFHLLRALEQRCGPALRIAPVDVPEERVAKWWSRLQKKFWVPRGYPYYSATRLRRFAEAVHARLPDDPQRPVVFFGALPFVECRPAGPYHIYTDGAFFIHYWEYNQDHSHAGAEIERICRAEAQFMSGAAQVWCSSQWVVDRIIKEYALPPERVRFVGTGPGDVPLPVGLVTYENSLAMIAADFERKRGRLAVEAVTLTRAQGIDLTIKFIGEKPPADVLALPFVEWCGWLDLNDDVHRARFAAVLSRVGAHILLSRADLTPLAIPEAASYAKATIAMAVGGIPEMIQDGVTGWLLDKRADAPKIAALLQRIFKHPPSLAMAGAAANAAYQASWNWAAVAAATNLAA